MPYGWHCHRHWGYKKEQSRTPSSKEITVFWRIKSASNSCHPSLFTSHSCHGISNPHSFISSCLCLSLLCLKISSLFFNYQLICYLGHEIFYSSLNRICTVCSQSALHFSLNSTDPINCKYLLQNLSFPRDFISFSSTRAIFCSHLQCSRANRMLKYIGHKKHGLKINLLINACIQTRSGKSDSNLTQKNTKASVFHLGVECQGKHPECLAGKWRILSLRNVTVICLNDLRGIYPPHK